MLSIRSDDLQTSTVHLGFRLTCNQWVLVRTKPISAEHHNVYILPLFLYIYSSACCKVSAKQRRCHLFWISTGLEGSSWLLPESIRKDMGGISLWSCWFQKSIMTEQMFNKKKKEREKNIAILYFAPKILHNFSPCINPIFFTWPTLNSQEERQTVIYRVM